MATDKDRPIPSRFTENIFRDPDLPPEKQDWLNRRNAAIRHWHNTGDPGPAAEFGFTLPDRRESGKADRDRESQDSIERRDAAQPA